MKTLKVLLIALFVYSSLLSQTNFQGGIYADTKWTKDKSPYIITGDIVVFPGKTLTIEPGVYVKFDGNYFIEIRGSLKAIGSENDTINFMSNKNNPQMSDWNGILININAEQSVTINYCKFVNATHSINFESSEWEGDIIIKNSIFKNNNYAMDGWAFNSVNIDSCIFINNMYAIYGGQWKNVNNSRFTNNKYGIINPNILQMDKCEISGSDTAVYMYNQFGEIKNSKIESNHFGIICSYKGVALNNNEILNNKVGIRFDATSNDSMKVSKNKICGNDINVENFDDTNKDLSGNCWCSLDSSEIESRLIDGYDNIYVGLLNYDIYSEDCETKLFSIQKVNFSLEVNKLDINDIINFYPNPFYSNIVIDIDRIKFSKISVSINNMFGQEVYKRTFSDNLINIELNNIKEGVYICTLKSESFIVTRKIIKR